MSDDDHDSNRTALKERLRSLMGDDILAYIDRTDLDLQTASIETRQKHNARTANYKFTQAAMGAPDSEAVRIATSNVILELIARNGDSSKDLFQMAWKELVQAGYDQDQSNKSIRRLVADQDELKRNWQKRTRYKLGQVIIKQLRAMKL